MPPRKTKEKVTKPKQEKLPEKLTQSEYLQAVRRSHAECSQEQAAAALEYREANRPLATRRKQRTRAARKARDERNSRLKRIREETIASSREGIPT